MKHGKYHDLVRVAREVCRETQDYYSEDGGLWEDDIGGEMYPHNVLDKMPRLKEALEKATVAKKGKSNG